MGSLSIFQQSQKQSQTSLTCQPKYTCRTQVALFWKVSYTQNKYRKAKEANTLIAKATSNPTEYDVVIVGGGIGGLSTLQALTKRYSKQLPNILLTESSDRVGGSIATQQSSEYLWEEGPNSFQPSDGVFQCAVDANLKDDILLGDPQSPRYVWWDNKLRETPSGPGSAVMFDLMTTPGKLRAGLGAMGLFKGKMPDKEESVSEFVSRNLGDQVMYRLIDPFCSGVYAGDPTQLSMKAAFNAIYNLEKSGGSLVAGALKMMQAKKKQPKIERNPELPPKPKGQTVGTFKNGLIQLPQTMAKNLADHINKNWKLQSILKDEQKNQYLLTYSTGQGNQTIKAKNVVLTAPAYIVSDILKDDVPKTSQALNKVEYPPVSVVTLSYNSESIREERKDSNGNIPGFGQLHPRSQGITTLGTIYASSLFPNRAPKGWLMTNSFIGGIQNKGIQNQKQEDVIAQVDKDLRVMLVKPEAPAPHVVGYRFWKRAIPQFKIGHLDVVEDAQKGLKEKGWDNVILSGNYISGVALGKCIEHGYKIADQLGNQEPQVEKQRELQQVA